MKPFKTYEEQMNILRERNLIVPDNSISILQDENYYNVINGYSKIFLKLDSNGKVCYPEIYKENTHIDEVYTLFKLDKLLRNIVLEYLLVFESNIKSRIAYYFSEEFNEPHSYLYSKNYSDDSTKTNSILQTISQLTKIMTNKNSKAIHHYISHHDGVPLWVLINYLTIGNISFLHQNLNDRVRTKIAISYSNKVKEQHKIDFHINPGDIDAILHQVNLYRNVCAHEEILYSYKIKRATSLDHIIKGSNILTGLKIENPGKETAFFHFIYSLKLFLNKKDFTNLIIRIDDAFNKYKDTFKSISVNEIYYIMQTPKNFDSFKKLIDDN